MVVVQKGLRLRKEWRFFLLAHAVALAFLFYLFIINTVPTIFGITTLSADYPSTPIFPHLLLTTQLSADSQLSYGPHQSLLLMQLSPPPSPTIPPSADLFYNTHSSSLSSHTYNQSTHQSLPPPPSPSSPASPDLSYNTHSSSLSSDMTYNQNGHQPRFLLPLIVAPYNITVNRPRSVAAAASCSIGEGKWVLDKAYPLYPHSSCPYVDESFSHRNGRSDLAYASWRWQPHACRLPRFNGTHLLERLQGKRLVFVGDSLNRNQYQSMACLLQQAIPKSKRAKVHHIRRGAASYGLFFKDYRFRLEFYRANFLVQEKQMVGMDGKMKETLKLDSMKKMWVKWRNAHILVFNTGHWWTHWKTDEGHNYFEERSKVHPRMKLTVAFAKSIKTWANWVDIYCWSFYVYECRHNYFEERSKVHPRMKLTVAFAKSIKTWANWVDTHVNTSTTQVFFLSYSPSHFSGGQWNFGGQCDNESLPIFNASYLNPFPEKVLVVQEIIRHMKTPVKILNVTKLSNFRKDGHPSIYGRNLKRQGINMFQDCSHWCLPGIPDLWNEILYAQIIRPNYYI